MLCRKTGISKPCFHFLQIPGFVGWGGYGWKSHISLILTWDAFRVFRQANESEVKNMSLSLELKGNKIQNDWHKMINSWILTRNVTLQTRYLIHSKVATLLFSRNLFYQKITTRWQQLKVTRVRDAVGILREKKNPPDLFVLISQPPEAINYCRLAF